MEGRNRAENLLKKVFGVEVGLKILKQDSVGMAFAQLKTGRYLAKYRKCTPLSDKMTIGGAVH